ncbi:MAG: Glucose-6-phosphate isomerase [Planctomycetes bacterium]|nr:Glucose-6-phosphate isomerase [Planctomycetota bacterium]
MNPTDLVQVDVTGALEGVGAGAFAAASDPRPPLGVSASDLDALVARGREVHDEILLARARGQVGFADLYMLGREAARARETSESLASRFDNVAVLAAGAEGDVVRAVLQALTHPFHNLLPSPGRAGRPRVFVVDSVDPDWLGAFLDAFAIEQTLVVCIGKSGDELGPLVQFAVARDVAKKRVGPSFKDHLVVVTDGKGGTLREEALREGLLSFEVPGNVPARYGALTPIGLLPAAIAGVDVRGVLGGAHAAAERTSGEDVRSNPAYLLASVLHLHALRGRRRHLFVAGAEALEATAVQAARLFEESVGAALREPAARRGCDAQVLPRDATALGRRCSTLRDELCVVLFEVSKHGRDRTVPKDAPGLPWLGGHTLSEYAIADSVSFRSVLAASGVPCVSVRLPSVAANTVGALHMTLLLSAAFGAGLAGGEPLAARGRDERERAIEARFRGGADAR